DNVGSAQEAAHSKPERGLAVSLNIPGDSDARLEALVIGFNSRVAYDKPAERVLTVIKVQQVITYTIIVRIGRREPGPPHAQTEGQVGSGFPGVIAIELEVVPAALGELVMIEFGVTAQRQILDQHLSNRITRAAIGIAELEEAVVTVGLFVLYIV